MSKKQVISLSQLGAGEQGTIVQLGGGRGLVGRLAALGFTPGAAVRVVRNPRSGPLLVGILDTQIALGQGQAQRVCVRRTDPDRDAAL